MWWFVMTAWWNQVTCHTKMHAWWFGTYKDLEPVCGWHKAPWVYHGACMHAENTWHGLIFWMILDKLHCGTASNSSALSYTLLHLITTLHTWQHLALRLSRFGPAQHPWVMCHAWSCIDGSVAWLMTQSHRHMHARVHGGQKMFAMWNDNTAFITCFWYKW